MCAFEWSQLSSMRKSEQLGVVSFLCPLSNASRCECVIGTKLNVEEGDKEEEEEEEEDDEGSMVLVVPSERS